MLMQIKFNNFLSFSKETTIDIKKTNYKLLEQNTNDNILKGVSFFGANASGKTNAIETIKLLLDLLFLDKDVNLLTKQCFFNLVNNPVTKMEYTFLINNQTIVYSFSFKGYDILDESLEIDKKNVLNRIGSSVRISISNNEAYNDVDKSILFLRKLYFNTKFEGNKLLQTWFAFLQNSIFFNAYNRKAISYGKFQFSAFPYLRENGPSAYNNFFQEYNFDFEVEYSNKSEGETLTIENEENTLFFKRKEIGIPIPYSMESLGNKTLVNFLPSLLYVAQNGGMLIIDEFSSGFHNELEELLIRHFMNHSNNAQMFLVSHSTNILSNSLLRPDQLYTVEFHGSEGSRLKRFSDEQPRVAQNIEKMYLSGVFGGIPQYDYKQE